MKVTRSKLKNAGVFALFTLPALTLIVCFILIPLLMALFYSLHDWNGISMEFPFIGLQNYIDLFSESAFLASFRFTFLYMIVTAAGLNIFGFLAALALNKNLKLSGILRAAYFLPMVICGVSVGYIWNVIVVRLFPHIGRLLGSGLLQKNWLSMPNTAFAALIIAAIWQSFGYYMMIYLTGLQGIPQNLLEAASIDGAGSLGRFFKIVLPLMRPTITVSIFLSIVSGLKSFDLIYALTSGGPYGSTTSIALGIYLDAFKRNLLSYASAKAILFCLIIMLISFAQVKLMDRKGVEQ